MGIAEITRASADGATRPSALRPSDGVWFREREGDGRRAALLDADPELAERIPAEHRATARRHLVVGVMSVRRGLWRPATDAVTRPLGLLVLTGSLMHDSCVADRWSTDILGPGDVLRPWEDQEGPDAMARLQEWHALENADLAVLDRRFVAVACRWPELVDELLARTTRRSRHLAMLRSVAGIRRLDERLLVLLRILADRWGHVCPDGIRLQIRLTHETLARLAGAQRPSVSAALARLRREGAIDRQGGVFVLPAMGRHDADRQPAGRAAARVR